MPIRELLVPLTDTEAGETALHTALLVAQQFNSHLRALHVRLDSRDITPMAGDSFSTDMIEGIMVATEREGEQRNQAVRQLFDRFMQQHKVPERPDDFFSSTEEPSASFVTLPGREEEIVGQQARLADLTIVPHPESDSEVSSSDALHAVLFDSGRPVLIAPKIMPASVGKRICIAWNGTAESAAAVLAVLPWLRHAESVRILYSADYQRSGPSVDALIQYLRRHGATPEHGEFKAIDRDVGAGLLAAATQWNADLLAMGAYSHSRLRQLILGGVTRHVLEHATLPVLMNS
jgi:nucleotide-binding universal stress UspA family protein